METVTSKPNVSNTLHPSLRLQQFRKAYFTMDVVVPLLSQLVKECMVKNTINS